MTDDTSKPPEKIAEAVGQILEEAAGPYAELYPSIVPRLKAAANADSPEIRKRMAVLTKALAARENHRRDRLIQMHGLTATEARLAAHLADGGSVAGYAQLFDVSVGTVRSQLKAVFAKTGVNRQSALAALVPRS
jgi:DNA-binding CsgD family transcriptional regulator